MVLGLVIIALVIVAIVLWAKIFKIPKHGNMILVTGGVKTGKSTLSVRLVYKIWKKQIWKYRLYNYVFYPLLHRIFKNKFKEKKDRPLIYSNIPLSIPFVPVTQELLMRKQRFVYGSVIYLCESSLVADSMLYKDETINEQLLLFNKLIGHETKGGYLIYDTQSVQDNHFSVKRCLNSYFYIHHTVKIPFFLLMYVREMFYSDDNSSVNAVTEDLEETLKIVVVPKSTWKMFDCYCYSAFTDHLPVASREKYASSLKIDKLCTFRHFKSISKVFQKDLESESINEKQK